MGIIRLYLEMRECFFEKGILKWDLRKKLVRWKNKGGVCVRFWGKGSVVGSRIRLVVEILR